ncbi:MAG: hypothetical protein LBI19_10755 [Oscillospiraceae bacterium]|jgi:hypothetical protein|nr:hypothetical protein [Oscillospiraceae bacterium]
MSDTKKPYESPQMDVKEFAQFENVFTYCNKGNAHTQGCVDITGTGNDADGTGDKSGQAAFSGGAGGAGDGSGGGPGSGV